MKIIPVFLSLIYLLGGVYAEDAKKTEVSPIVDSSVMDKNSLKKLPRLGMTYKQLEKLWGKGKWGGVFSDDTFGYVWHDLGGVDISVFIKAEWKGDDAVDPPTFPCERIEFSYPSKKIDLKFGEIVDIAERLLPGFHFERKLKNGEKWDNNLLHKGLVSQDPKGTYILKQEYGNRYVIYFTTPLKIEVPEQKAKLDLDRI